MAASTLLIWIIASLWIAGLYVFLPRLDPGPRPLTRERQGRFRFVMLATWIVVSIGILLGGSGFEQGRLELYGLVIVAGVLVFAVIRFKRYWDSRL